MQFLGAGRIEGRMRRESGMVPALATTPARTSLQVVLGNREFKDSDLFGRLVVLGNCEFKDSDLFGRLVVLGNREFKDGEVQGH